MIRSPAEYQEVIAADRQYYTSSEEFSLAVADKMKEKALEHGVKSLYEIQPAALLNAIGVRMYMYKGEQLFATRIDSHGFYFLDDPTEQFIPL